MDKTTCALYATSYHRSPCLYCKKAIMSEGELTVNIAVVKVMKTRLFLLQQKHT